MSFDLHCSTNYEAVWNTLLIWVLYETQISYFRGMHVTDPMSFELHWTTLFQRKDYKDSYQIPYLGCLRNTNFRFSRYAHNTDVVRSTLFQRKDYGDSFGIPYSFIDFLEIVWISLPVVSHFKINTLISNCMGVNYWFLDFYLADFWK